VKHVGIQSSQTEEAGVRHNSDVIAKIFEVQKQVRIPTHNFFLIILIILARYVFVQVYCKSVHSSEAYTRSPVTEELSRNSGIFK
jgi:hypothetical protein